MSSRTRKALGKVILPSESIGEESLVARMLRNQERMANDPVIQARRERVRREFVKEMRPYFVGGVVFNAVLWAAARYYVPNIATTSL